MKIQFCTYPTKDHAVCIFGFGCLVFAIGCFNAYLLNLFGEIEKSVILSRGLNVTRTAPFFYCELPYDDCLCSVLLNKSENSKQCIIYVQLMGSRILPSISFFLQIYLVQKVFSLNSDCHRVFIYALHILSIFTSTSMIIVIFRSSCYHGFITYGLLLTGWLLFVLSCYNVVRHERRVLTSRPHSNIVVAVHISWRNGNPNRALREFPWIKIGILYLWLWICSFFSSPFWLSIICVPLYFFVVSFKYLHYFVFFGFFVCMNNLHLTNESTILIE
jgi:hypothetical protein